MSTLASPTIVKTDAEIDESSAIVDGVESPEDLAEDSGSHAMSSDPNRGRRWRRILVVGVLPALVMLLALTAGLLKYWQAYSSEVQLARTESVQAAKESTIAMLSYQPATVAQELTAAQERLTGAFRDSYAELTHDVVIPGSQQKHISTVANVPAAALVSATPSHAVVLLFVNQAAIVGTDTPTDTASTVRVTLDKVRGHWLISGFDPI